MNTNIQIFTSDVFGEIRSCLVNNQIMFVGKDVATALGYSNTSKAIQKHVDKEDKSTLPIRETAYETRAIIINESGLYALILSSKLPQAKAFKRWVTAEVLPQIRMTGGYIPTRLRTYVSYSLKGEKKVRTYMTWMPAAGRASRLDKLRFRHRRPWRPENHNRLALTLLARNDSPSGCRFLHFAFCNKDFFSYLRPTKQEKN